MLVLSVLGIGCKRSAIACGLCLVKGFNKGAFCGVPCRFTDEYVKLVTPIIALDAFDKMADGAKDAGKGPQPSLSGPNSRFPRSWMIVR